ncbi:response regulator [Caenispirillum salinarum]|uniref:response regulator n=1 Tax=Caenispirillum salinarum TaxID=859058 RepID=UPI0038508107
MIGFDGGQLKVLLVEDNEHFRRLLRTVLQALGITDVREEADGGAGLAALATYPADLVIVDYRMTPMDGLEFTRRLRREPGQANPYVPVLMVTGYTEPRLVAQARDAGVNEFLAKPISAKMLLSRIVQVLQTPRAFVSASDYFGPDRRRRQTPIAHPERRRCE